MKKSTLLYCLSGILLVHGLMAQSSGALDNLFSGDGKLATSFGSNDVANAIAIIPLSGNNTVSVGSTGNQVAVTRNNNSGALVTNFSTDGKQQTTIPNGTEAVAYGVAVQTDGKIVVVGSYRSTVDFVNRIYDFFIIRYLVNGDLDTSFDGDGILQFNGSLTDFYYGVAIQTDGKIIAVGTQNSAFVVRRYLTTGALDAGFGSGGTATTINVQGEARAVVIQPDGKIVVGGEQISTINGTTYGDFAVVRLNINGTLDTSFDTDGKVATNINIETPSDDRGRAVVLQTDGKIIVAGNTYIGSSFDIALVRYNANGTIDTSFDSDGKLTTSIGTGDDVANAVSVLPNGKIVVAGTSRTASYTYEVVGTGGERDFKTVPANDDMVVLEYSNNGGLDDTFSGDGKNIVAFIEGQHDYGNAMLIKDDGRIIVAGSANNGTDNDFAFIQLHGIFDFTTIEGTVYTSFTTNSDYSTCTVVQPDGKILVAGYSFDGLNNSFAVARYTIYGTLDNTFSGDGKQIISFGASSEANSIAVQPDGKIVIAGTNYNGFNSDFVVARLLPNGSLDTSFDTDGKLTIHINESNRCYEVVIQSDNKILLGGNSGNSSGNENVVLVRLNENGNLDTGFGSGGIASVNFSFNIYIYSMKVQNNKAVLTGYSDGKFLAIRFNSNGSLDTSFDIDGIVSTSIEEEGGSTAVGIQSDGKVIVFGEIDSYFAVFRYNSDGSLDNSFANAGKLIADFKVVDNGTTVIIQPDGKILFGFTVFLGGEYNNLVVRVNSDGTFDETFGNQGKLFVKSLGGFTDLALGADGKMYMSTSYFTGYDFGLTAVLPCKTSLLALNHPTNDINKVLNSPFEAKVIEASNWVLNTGKATYEANKSIELKPGFKTNANAVFKAEIKKCEYYQLIIN